MDYAYDVVGVDYSFAIEIFSHRKDVREMLSDSEKA